jgi:hypothetical protein
MQNIWQISPGRKERGLWPEFKSGNIIGMGWDELGDLSIYASDIEIESALKRIYHEDSKKRVMTSSAC